MKKTIWLILWILALDFVFFALYFIPAFAQMFYSFAPWSPILVLIIFFLFGIVLLVSTMREKAIRGLFKRLLFFTALFSIAIPIGFAVLGALIPLIANIVFNIILAAFLMGLMGSMVFARKQRFA